LLLEKLRRRAKSPCQKPLILPIQRTEKSSDFWSQHRALIRWTAKDLARHSAVSVTTIRRAELTPSMTALTRANDQAIRRALEQAGIEFIDAEGGGPGVRLRTPPSG
jgi:hypothetical protein